MILPTALVGLTDPGAVEHFGHPTTRSIGLLPGEFERRHIRPPSNLALRTIVEEDPRLVRILNARYADAAATREAVWAASAPANLHSSDLPWARALS
jgi:hypothetical protein